jgi:hypothetical protein
MDDRWAVPLLLFVAAITVGAYLLAWRSKRPALKNTGTALTLAIVAVGAFVTTFGALRLPSDFFQPGVPKSTTAIAEVLCCCDFSLDRVCSNVESPREGEFRCATRRRPLGLEIDSRRIARKSKGRSSCERPFFFSNSVENLE